jgi:hypothetical protein
MKLALCILLFMGIYFLLSVMVEGQTKITTRKSGTQDERKVLFRGRNSRRQERMKRAAKIFCTFLVTGRMPHYQMRLGGAVTVQWRKISRMSKENQKKFCGQFQISTITTRRPTTRTTQRTFPTFFPPFFTTTPRVLVFSTLLPLQQLPLQHLQREILFFQAYQFLQLQGMLLQQLKNLLQVALVLDLLIVERVLTVAPLITRENKLH